MQVFDLVHVLRRLDLVFRVVLRVCGHRYNVLFFIILISDYYSKTRAMKSNIGNRKLVS